jgi:transposase-like protein
MAALVEMVLKGVSHRRAEDVLAVMGVKEVSPSQISRFLGRLDEHVEAFRKSPIDGEYPYVYLDAKFEKARVKGLPTQQAVLIAIGIRQDGHRRVLGVEIWPDETGPGWKAFLEGLVRRGLRGVQLVISDAHLGLKEAIPRVFVGAAWQRCRVHFMRNVLAKVHRSKQPIVAALVRTIFAQGSRDEAVAQLHWVVSQLEAAYPECARLLESAEGEVLSYMAFPYDHWTHIHSTNVLERLNRELAHRTRLVGIFPSTQSLLRYVGALLLEIDDDWQVEERRYLSRQSMNRLFAKRPALNAPAA